MRKFRQLLFIFSILAVILFSVSAHAEKTAYTAGILNDYEFSGNNIIEYAKDSVQSAFEYTENTEVNFTELNLKNSINALNNNSISFLCMVPWNDTLASYVDYTTEPIAIGFLALFSNSDSNIYFEDFMNLNNTKIGLIKYSVFEKQLNAYAAEHNFNYMPVYFDTVKELTSAIASNSVDAILVPTTVKPEGLNLIAKCGSFEYYCTVKKGNTEMLNLLNTAISSLKINSPFYLSSIYSEHFRIPYLNTAALTFDESVALKNQDKLRILIPDDNYPMAYYDTEKSAYAGIYIDIMEKVSKNSGISIEYVPGDLYHSPIDCINAGKADAILTVSGSTQGLVTATEPYTSISYLAIAKNNTSVFEDSKLQVGILSDDDWIIDYLCETHPNWQIEQYNSINSLLRAVEHGKIKIALLSTPDMQTKTSLIAHPKLSIVNDFSICVPVSLGVSNLTCPKQVVNLLNKIIQSVSVSESEFESKVYTLSHIYVPNFRDMIYANKWWLIVILLAFITVLVIIKTREAYFKKLSRTDSITHIYNRMYFNQAVDKTLLKNPDQPYLLASVDARNFKLINERFGRIIGDQTLANIAQKIKEIFKDIGVYARYRGDCFLIFTEDSMLGKSLFEKLAEINIYIHDSSKYQIPIKIGICPIPKYNPDITIADYIDRANIAKNSSPVRNTNCLVYFTPEMEQELTTRNNIEVEMVQALNRGDFIVYYQPKYELATDKIIGAEALVRWIHKDKGIISPGIFVPLFEKNGFIVELDFYVYETVLQMIRSRIRGKDPIVPISMNVSRCHLGDEHFVERLEKLVNKYQIPKKYIEMEITESIFSQEDSSALALIYELKEHGFTISMDDFGSGYSSLNLLRKVPIDTLKIDKEFIDNAENSQRSEVIVEEIISMASKIHVKTICEGVETKTQRDFLKRAGCDMAQGFFYSKPLSYREFETLLNSSN
ncbi:MAG: EAL domain-containing protein [Hominilimicola sp.]